MTVCALQTQLSALAQSGRRRTAVQLPLHCACCVVRFAFAFCILHFALSIQQFAYCILHFAFAAKQGQLLAFYDWLLEFFLGIEAVLP